MDFCYLCAEPGQSFYPFPVFMLSRWPYLHVYLKDVKAVLIVSSYPRKESVFLERVRQFSPASKKSLINVQSFLVHIFRWKRRMSGKTTNSLKEAAEVSELLNSHLSAPHETRLGMGKLLLSNSIKSFS